MLLLRAVLLADDVPVRIISVAGEHMTVRSYHCADAPLHVISINIPYTVIHGSIILVRAHQLCQLPISMIKAAGDTAVLFRPADLTVAQVIGNHRFSALTVFDFREVSGSV